MITSIQVHEHVKQQLDQLKNGKESYEEVIQSLITQAEMQKRTQKDLLIEGYREMAQESLKQVKGWASADLDWD